MTTGHLTDEQFSAAMLGESLDADGLAHVRVCVVCRDEIAGFEQAVGNLAAASRGWSEARSGAMPVVRATPGRTKPTFAPAYVWAAAGVLAVTAGVTILDHVRDLHPATIAAVAAGGDEAGVMDSPEQIERDNQLLAEVHFELTRTDLPEAERHAEETTSKREGRQP